MKETYRVRIKANVKGNVLYETHVEAETYEDAQEQALQNLHSHLTLSNVSAIVTDPSYKVTHIEK